MVDVADAPAEPGAEVSLIVAGGPTHAFSMSKPATRAEAHQRGAPNGSDAVGIREWLDTLPTGSHPQTVATFDTKSTRVRHLPGSAKKAGRVAGRHGYSRADHAQSFLVADTEGPLLDGELERAVEWGRHLATPPGHRRIRRAGRSARAAGRPTASVAATWRPARWGRRPRPRHGCTAAPTGSGSAGSMASVTNVDRPK